MYSFDTLMFLLLYGHTARVVLLAILVILSVLDYFTTTKALKTNPSAREGNPIARVIIDKLGYVGLAGFKVLSVIGLMVLGIYTQNYILMIVNAVMAFIVYRNFTLIKNTTE